MFVVVVERGTFGFGEHALGRRAALAAGAVQRTRVVLESVVVLALAVVVTSESVVVASRTLDGARSSAAGSVPSGFVGFA